MKKKWLAIFMTMALASSMFTGCGGKKEEAPAPAADAKTEEASTEEAASEETASKEAEATEEKSDSADASGASDTESASDTEGAEASGSGTDVAEGEGGTEDGAAAAEDATADSDEGIEGPEETNFSLLDVESSMVTVGVYGGDSDGTELVFTMFTGPDGLDYTSLFDFNGKGGGDVFCGQYERQTETDEDGTMWTKLTVHDVYTDKDITLGVGETTDDKVFFYDSDGNVIEGKYLSKEETIDYMASAVNVLRSLDKGLGD